MKMRFIKKHFVLCGLLLLALPLLAADVNNSAAAYLRMGIGARIVAMGEAGSAVTQDIASVHWNPAGLARLKDIELGTMYNLGLDNDRTHTYASLGTRFGFGALALSWVNAGVSDIEGYLGPTEPTGTFSDTEQSIALSYANYIGRFSFGVTPKLYYSSLDGETETGFGVDTGLKVSVSQYLDFGAMARDLAGKYAEDKIPWELSAGLAAYPLSGITLALDAKMEQDESIYPCFGAEYWTSIGKDPEADSQLSVIQISEKSSWEDALSNIQTGLRLGYNQERISVGTGVRFKTLQLDYVFRLNKHDVFGNDHIISMILRF